jgi:hypothetical protein
MTQRDWNTLVKYVQNSAQGKTLNVKYTEYNTGRIQYLMAHQILHYCKGE